MDLKCKLIEKTFKDSEGNTHKYSVLSFTLIDDSTLEISIKGDKARLLRLSNQKDNDFWDSVDR